MRVIIEASLFAPERIARAPLDLDTLFGLCVDQDCHAVEVEPPEAPEFMAWLKELSPAKRGEIEVLLGAGLERQVRNPPTHTLRVADVLQEDWGGPVPRFSLPVALRLLRNPLRVLIEGPKDEAFLRRTVPRSYRETFERWLHQDMLRLDYRGGVENLQQAIEQECADRTRHLRMFTVFDSDARKPDEPGDPSRRLARLCGRRAVRHHMLKRRAIENYIPEPALERWMKKSHPRDFDARWLPKLRAFRQLAPIQRQHYNMKKGLRADEEGPGLADLYDGLAQSPEVRPQLEEGFGDAVADAFKDELPDAWREADGQTAELTQLFEALLRAA